MNTQIVNAFVDALSSVKPDAPTACAGWSVHELTAHLAAGSAEIADAVDGELEGGPSRPTRDFEERESPYRALAPEEVREAFFREALRAAAATERLAEAGAQVWFTGVRLDAATLVAHIESELVLHRWDLVGSDDLGVDLLSDPRLGDHAVNTVTGMRPDVFPARSGPHQTILLRACGARDVAVTGGAVTSVTLAGEQGHYPAVVCHPAARTLLLWGRRPEGLPAPVGDPDTVAKLVGMLCP